MTMRECPNVGPSAEPTTPRAGRRTSHLQTRSINRWALLAFLLWLSGAGLVEAGDLSAQPVTALRVTIRPDFNGDGAADLLWRHSSGVVAIWLMNGPTAVSVGSAGNVPTDWTIAGVADFNRDGKTDILWRHAS